MSDHDHAIEARLDEASRKLIASFSDLDAEAELRSVRGGVVPARMLHASGRWPRWLTAAAAVALLSGGTVAVAVSVAMRSDDRVATTPATSPVATSTPIPTEPTTPTSAAATTEPSTPIESATTGSPTTASGTAGPAVESPSDVFVTVSGDRPAVIDVRDVTGVVASFDLSCPQNRECVVQSARVMGDTIWAAITDSDPGQMAGIVRSRVVSVSLSSGDVVEQLVQDGVSAVRSAGLGADGVLYADFDGEQPAERQLVAIDGGEARILETGVAGFQLSDDGRFLAVSLSNPQAAEPARFEITDLVDQTTANFQTPYINAGPAAWSPDGRYLIADEQWEDQTAWLVDPWSGSGEPISGTERFLDGACFMDSRVVAHRTWKVGYGQGDAQPGVIELTSLETGSTVAEIGEGLFGDGFRCHPDGSISYLRRPVVEVELSPGFSQLEPDYDAPVDLIHIGPDGTTSVIASGDLRLV